MKEIPVVLLAGGLGTRLREQTEFVPKALVKVGSLPIIVHVMAIYSHYGYKKFIVSIGYKGDMIKDYFLNFNYYSRDFTLSLPSGNVKFNGNSIFDDVEIKFVDTGADTDTGGRIKLVEKYVDTDFFLANYTDGVSNVDISNLVSFHKDKKKIATLTGVHQYSQYGIIDTSESLATSFKEKPALPGIVNGGYYVFDKRMFDYLQAESRLENEPLERLTKERELAVYVHDGFWASMDTQKDVNRLNDIWNSNKVPWKMW